MKPTDASLRQLLDEDAIDWVMRERTGQLTSAAKEELLQWLLIGPQHVASYVETCEFSQRMPGALRQLAPDTLPPMPQRPNNVISLRPFDVSASRRNRHWLRRFLGTAAAALLTTGLIWAGLHFTQSQTFRVAHGDQRTVRLEDGSLVHLNSDAEVRVRYTPNERRIELVQGQALFKVAKNRARPFRVTAGGTEVVAVGTQFDVDRQAQATTVTVIEGKVDIVNPPQGAITVSTPDQRSPRIRLAAGEQVRVKTAGIVTETRAADLQVATAWMRREIVANGRPIGELAEEYNRYLPTPILIEDEALRQRQVTGTFSADDPKLFFAFLRRIHGVVIEDTADAVRVRVAVASGMSVESSSPPPAHPAATSPP